MHKILLGSLKVSEFEREISGIFNREYLYKILEWKITTCES